MDSPTVKKIFKTVNFQNIWIFVTNKCNLNCDYCFFSDRKKDTNLTYQSLLKLLEAFPLDKKYCFVLSGGEPLLCWQHTKKIIRYLRKMYPKSSISLQTNILLLSIEKAKFLKEKNVIVEPGIDGGFSVTSRHRRGLDKENFQGCLQNIRMIVEYNLDLNPTMTVCPQEVESMFENFKYLVNLGLNYIEVHPAFMADWTYQKGKIFLENYKKVLDYDKSYNGKLVCKDYSKIIKKSIDLVIQPNGSVLPNWTFLTFPQRLRKSFFIFQVSKGKVKIFRENMINYLKKVDSFFGEKRSYRNFSNFNASLILAKQNNPKMKGKFEAYKNICIKIQKMDKIFIKNS
ncbi:MAG: radical SAM protein [Candidatus Omnitrophica bacterium]|nr:radical SAM protein [Candidatus Omnitrophota bacterium]